MPGPAPKPSALKIVAGNPGKRAINKQEPDPAYLNDLTAPAGMNQAAQDVWNEIAPKLRAARVLTELDVPLLIMGCNAIAQNRMAVNRLGENLIKSKTAIGEDGEPTESGEYINPWMMVQSMSFKQAMAVFREFGMSPAARTRIAIQPQGDLFHGQDSASTYFT